MKTTIKTLIAIALLGASFIGGVLWEYSAERQEIADIEQVAIESCNVRIKMIKKMCK